MGEIKSVRTIGYDDYISDFRRYARTEVEPVSEEKLKEDSMEDYTALYMVNNPLFKEDAVDGIKHDFCFAFNIDDNILSVIYKGMR